MSVVMRPPEQHALQSDPSMTIAFITLSPVAGQFGGPAGNGIMLFGNFIEAFVGMKGASPSRSKR